MASQKQPKKTGIKNISLEVQRGAFSSFFHFFSGEDQFQEVGPVRALLSNERAKIIHTIKESKPQSIYHLAKLLGRDFKAVRKDIALLEHFGIIRLEKQGRKAKNGHNKESLRPVLNLDSLQININF